MAHELEIMANGQAAMFAVGQTPWHGLGKVLNAPPTVEEGIKLAGMDWTVGLKALHTVDCSIPVDHRATYRVDNGKILGVVGPAYRPLQNAEMFAFFQPLVDAGEIALHTAGSLQDGRKVWVLAEITKPALEIADGDTVKRFMLLSGSHDGSRAVRCGFTPIRVVCANTLRMAHNSERDENKLVKVLHTKNITTTLAQLRDVMMVANSSFEATAEQYRRLTRCPINRADLRKYVKVVLEVEKIEDRELPGRTLTKIREIEMAATRGKGNENPAVRGTLWTAYNGVTEYLGYTHGRTNESRVDSLWFGESARVSQRAFEVAVSMAG